MWKLPLSGPNPVRWFRYHLIRVAELPYGRCSKQGGTASRLFVPYNTEMYCKGLLCIEKKNLLVPVENFKILFKKGVQNYDHHIERRIQKRVFRSKISYRHRLWYQLRTGTCSMCRRSKRRSCRPSYCSWQRLRTEHSYSKRRKRTCCSSSHSFPCTCTGSTDLISGS